MRHTRPTTQPPAPGSNPGSARGFTLIELLVVIFIMALLVGISFPVLSALQSGSRIEAGLNTIGMSVDVARQWVAPSAWEDDNTNLIQSERYSGCAALYTPNGEVRIVTNFRNARERGTNRYLEDNATATSPNGYRDRSGGDYIVIPNGVGVAGILRTGTGNNVEFIAPPFAIAFNEEGQLYLGDTTGRIYYDGVDAGGRTDGRFDTGANQRSGYNPSQWDGGSGARNEDVISQDRPIRALPFEAIECVPGVIIYDQDDFTNAGFSFDGGGSVAASSAAGQWLEENGRTLFFSPHTGIALRDEQE